MKKTINPQSGNVFLYILLAIVLLGMMTAFLRNSSNTEEHIDREKAVVLAGQILKHSSEFATAAQTLLANGASETDLRFAHPKAHSSYGLITATPQHQIFSPTGGKAVYRDVPKGAYTVATKYEFAGQLALPQLGSAKADLLGYLPNVNDAVCNAINSQIGITEKPVVSGCATSTFSGNFATSPTTYPAASFATLPITKACIYCSNLSINSFVFTILAR